jgi:hypothetical protein
MFQIERIIRNVLTVESKSILNLTSYDAKVIAVMHNLKAESTNKKRMNLFGKIASTIRRVENLIVKH